MTSKIIAALVVIAIYSSCSLPSKYGSKTRGEITMIRVHKGEAIDPQLLAMHEDYQSGNYVASRGFTTFFDPTVYATSAIDVAATGIKNIIRNEQKKYQAQYQFNIEPTHWHRLKDDSLYFYKNISSLGTFDPEGMQFTGFTVARLIKKDTAMKAVFELDNANLCEIYHDGIFRLKLKQLELNYAKAKIPQHGKKKINLDFHIQFVASYITSSGQLYPNIVLGNFSLILPGVELRNKNSWKRFEGTPLTGSSFIVPRSFGYKKVGNNMSPIYSQGAYAINVTVKEISKPKYVNKLLADETNTVIDVTQKGISVKLGNASSSGTAGTETPGKKETGTKKK